MIGFACLRLRVNSCSPELRKALVMARPESNPNLLKVSVKAKPETNADLLNVLV